MTNTDPYENEIGIKMKRWYGEIKVNDKYRANGDYGVKIGIAKTPILKVISTKEGQRRIGSELENNIIDAYGFVGTVVIFGDHSIWILLLE